MQLSVVLPCLNEAETLERCVRKAQGSIAEARIEGEVVIADNGSTDGSIELAERCGARVVPVAAKGYGNALHGGILAARGKWIVMGDSDDSYDFSRLGPFLEALRGGADLVMGCRMPRGGGTIMPGAMPWKHRWLGNPVLSFIGRLFFQCPIHDFHCGLRAFTKEAYLALDLRTTGMEFASEMVIKATLRGLALREVPITLHKDGRSRPPHLRSWRDGWRHLRFMLLFSPSWLFVWPGALCCAVGTLFFTALCFEPIHLGGVRLDTNTMLVAAMMMLIGFQVAFLGIFARLFCEALGLLPRHTGLARLMRYFSLERGIVAGLALGTGGGIFLARAVEYWGASHFGEQSYPASLRLVIPAVTLLMLGAQHVFSSFFLSVLDLSKSRPGRA